MTMQQLQFTELDDHGRLVLEDGTGKRYALPVDDRVRAALRPRPVRAAEPGRQEASATPREVQAMIRAGQSAQEVATATGWELARVQRFEGPVLAEREHVVGLAKVAHVRAHGRTDGSHTLERRVRERLQTRGVAPADVTWDAARSEAHGPWTVLVIFEAGGKERRAAWHYEVQDRSIEALDDEARWLSEDEQALPGGLAGHPLLGSGASQDETHDLMATMRARRQRRARRTVRQTADRPTGEEDATGTGSEEGTTGSGDGEDTGQASGRGDGGTDDAPRGRSGGGRKRRGRATPAPLVDEVLPLEDLAFDEATMGTPPAAHPRGSAPESPTPIAVVAAAADAVLDEELVDADLTDQDQSVADLEDEHVEEESVEGVYARTRHDPYEVSFDEFFGTDDDYDEDEDYDEDQGEGQDYHQVEDEPDDGDAGLEDGHAGTLHDDEPVDGAVQDLDPGLTEAAIDPAHDDGAADDIDEKEEGDELEGTGGVDEDGVADDVEASDGADGAPEPSEGADVDPSDDDDGDDDGSDNSDSATSAGSGSGGDIGDSDDDGASTDETDNETDGTDDTDGTDEAADQPAARGTTSRRKGRPSVPSWDDIMFGSGGKRR